MKPKQPPMLTLTLLGLYASAVSLALAIVTFDKDSLWGLVALLMGCGAGFGLLFSGLFLLILIVEEFGEPAA